MSKHEGFLNATLTIVGTLVSILLGLLVANSIEYYDSVEANATSEATCVSEIFKLATALPDQPKNAIQDSCLRYNKSVLNKEWPAMENGHMSPESAAVFGDLNRAIVTFHSSNDSETNIQNALLTTVLNLGDYRRRRAMALESTWSERILPVILFCAIIVLAYTYLYTRREAKIMHAVLICFVAGALGGNIGMIFLLRKPFATDWKITPSGFVLTEELLKEYKANGRLR